MLSLPGKNSKIKHTWMGVYSKGQASIFWVEGSSQFMAVKMMSKIIVLVELILMQVLIHLVQVFF